MFNPLSQYLMIGKLVALLGAIALICWQSSQIHRWHHQFDSERTARIADRQTYINAQTEARRLNDLTLARVKSEQQRITDHAEQTYGADRARLRAELDRLLAQIGALKGASGSSGLPNVSPAPSGPDGSARVSIPSDLYVRGAELELQLEQLQQWVNKQLAVNPNAH